MDKFWKEFPKGIWFRDDVFYVIKTVEALEDPEAKTITWGTANNVIGEIVISRKNWAPSIAISTLIHEITHAALFVNCLQGERRKVSEESFCIQMEVIWPEIIKRNPGLFQWMSKWLNQN